MSSSIIHPFTAVFSWDKKSGPMFKVNSCPDGGVWNAFQADVEISTPTEELVPPKANTQYGPYSNAPYTDGWWLPKSQVRASVSNAPIGPASNFNHQAAYLYINNDSTAFGIAFIINFMPAAPRSGENGQFAHLGILCGGSGTGISISDYLEILKTANITPTIVTDPIKYQVECPAVNFTLSVS